MNNETAKTFALIKQGLEKLARPELAKWTVWQLNTQGDTAKLVAIVDTWEQGAAVPVELGTIREIVPWGKAHADLKARRARQNAWLARAWGLKKAHRAQFFG